MKCTYLVTGAAGFIGFYVAKRLSEEGNIVIGIDNLNDYYDVNLKEKRLEILRSFSNFIFYKIDISNHEQLNDVFKLHKIEYVIHLAAQAGVRYSIENPKVYLDSNIIGFFNILEACRWNPVKHLIYASSSSVYGANKKVPFEETDFVDNPVSFYAATKKSNELMAYTYSHLYDIPTTGLRFFTVYGPMGRPDMAYFSFVDKFFADEPIKIFNNENFDNDMYRDFTYVDDIVEGIIRIVGNPPKEKPKSRVLNIGNNTPEKLMYFIETLETCLSNSLGRPIFFKKEFEPIKQGDVWKTYASTNRLEEIIDFKPRTPINEGLQKFTDWYCEFYNKK
ncbi:MAG: NAD-dependent epimerase/dehydratase family protein [Bacilli bacterium]|nr:NAD-dependent epimerase/dehydratase family protein [Bacilli bacterium]